MALRVVFDAQIIFFLFGGKLGKLIDVALEKIFKKKFAFFGGLGHKSRFFI